MTMVRKRGTTNGIFWELVFGGVLVFFATGMFAEFKEPAGGRVPQTVHEEKGGESGGAVGAVVTSPLTNVSIASASLLSSGRASGR